MMNVYAASLIFLGQYTGAGHGLFGKRGSLVFLHLGAILRVVNKNLERQRL